APVGVLGRTVRLEALGDDFEAADWAWDAKQYRDTHGRWSTSYRGGPKKLARVTPPAGGVPGSTGALSLRTEGDRDSYPNQDDLIHFFNQPGRLERLVTRADQPVFVVRVWLPPFAEWTPGWNNLGFRHEARSKQLVTQENKVGYYYPSIWLQHVTDKDHPERSGPRWCVRIGTGVAPDEDAGPIPQPGWWTLALAFDERGVGHYYVRPGTGPLGAEHEIWDTTKFRPTGGENPLMDSVAYGFFSLGYPPDGRLTPFVVDDYEVWVQPVANQKGN
ncbi:MAG: hypothetical protein N3A53_02555, partial [Verrucomicrobiae bacterium]|nr:hypothetical protein [Verrucomicrobiae bacterium]